MRRGRLLDPIVAHAVLSAHTERIGLIVTATTSYNDPYNLARQFAALAAVSHGRAGWNVVVTGGDAAARNYSLDAAPAKADRDDRAAEFLDVVAALWDSWSPGALVADRGTGRYLDPALIRPIDHVGKHFRVADRESAAAAGGQAGADPGRRLHPRRRIRRTNRRCHIHRARRRGFGPAAARGGARAGDGRGPEPGYGQTAAGPDHRSRRHRGGRARPRTRTGRPYPRRCADRKSRRPSRCAGTGPSI